LAGAGDGERPSRASAELPRRSRGAPTHPPSCPAPPWGRQSRGAEVRADAVLIAARAGEGGGREARHDGVESSTFSSSRGLGAATQREEVGERHDGTADTPTRAAREGERKPAW
jgi:hypothetical protein